MYTHSGISSLPSLNAFLLLYVGKQPSSRTTYVLPIKSMNRRQRVGQTLSGPYKHTCEVLLKIVYPGEGRKRGETRIGGYSVVRISSVVEMF